jgi:hypothetical protein
MYHKHNILKRAFFENQSRVICRFTLPDLAFLVCSSGAWTSDEDEAGAVTTLSCVGTGNCAGAELLTVWTFDRTPLTEAPLKPVGIISAHLVSGMW